MKVLYIYPFCGVGGVEISLKNRLSYLNRVIKADVLFLKELGGLCNFNDVEYGVYLTKDIEEINGIISKYDVVILIDTAEFIGIVNFKSQVLIYESHSVYTKQLEKIEGISKMLNTVVVPSNYMKGIFESYNPNENININIIPNIVELENSYLSYKEIECPTLIWIGRYDDQKGWKEFLSIFKEVVEIEPRYNAVMLGNIGYDTKMINKYLDKINYSDKDKIKFFSIIQHKNMKNLYKRVGQLGGALVITSKDESYGMTMAEAALVNCPVITPKLKVLTEIFKSNNYYFNYERMTNGSSIARGIVDYLDLPRQLSESEVVEYAKLKEEEVEMIVDKHIQLFKQCMREKF